MAQEQAKKVMNKTVLCKKSKAGNLYLVSEKDGKTTFVNLVKYNKRYTPKLREDNSYEIEFTSYALDEENKRVTLFNVSGI